MPKITIIGAGGYVFPVRLCVDILSFPELRDSTLHLYDINPQSLARTHGLIQGLVKRLQYPTVVESGTDRKRALAGADFVIVAFQVGGVNAYRHDVEIPRRYGVDQPVGDTLGPGGVFRGLRSLTAFEGIARDLKALAPEALVLQYANPMAINCWYLNLQGIKTVGLCHSVQGTSWMLTDKLGLKLEDVTFRCAGVNHQAWFTEFRQGKRDLYPRLRRVMDRKFPSPAGLEKPGKSTPRYAQRGLDHRADDDLYYQERVRTEIMRTFGYFHSESSHHGSEYLAWFRKDARRVKAYLPRRWDYYKISCSYRQGEHQGYLKDLVSGEPKLSEEYGGRIIHSCVVGEKRVIYGNVPNWGRPGSPKDASRSRLISNLPDSACVEVACLVDRNGVQPLAFGDLPPQCAAINRQSIAVQELAVEGFLKRSRAHVVQAVAMDPLTQVHCTLPQVRRMVGELFAAEKEWIKF
jgi:alpha-galactosidase